MCTKFAPSLDDFVDLGATWTIILDGVDAELSRGAEKPELDASVDCSSWATKFGTQDIGEADIWCDAGRAYECIELANAERYQPAVAPRLLQTHTASGHSSELKHPNKVSALAT